MSQNSAIITVNLLRCGIFHDLEVPLDISANELCQALFEKYLPEYSTNISQFFLRSERPVALLRGDRTLREYGICDGSVINIVR